MIQFKRAHTLNELRSIKALQDANLRKNLSEEEAIQNGFLMAEYSTKFIQQMNEVEPHIIAVDQDQVVGYALVSTHKTGADHTLLLDLYNNIDLLKYNNIELKNASYVIVGQLCVAKSHRGTGLSQQLYQHFRNELQHQFDYCITDVATENARSIKAHLKTGFKIIYQINYGGISWEIILWDWSNKSMFQTIAKSTSKMPSQSQNDNAHRFLLFFRKPH
jgi:L-amino acid N-acyltransferase YncA